jgi:dCMP deaminase
LTRPSWDEYFGNIARVVATRATCPRASCGAVLVRDNRILATGYNGAPAGKSHCLDVGCDVVDNHCQRALHAEVNAVAYAARAGINIDGAKIYISAPLPICRECAKVLVAAGVEFG